MTNIQISLWSQDVEFILDDMNGPSISKNFYTHREAKRDIGKSSRGMKLEARD